MLQAKGISSFNLAFLDVVKARAINHKVFSQVGDVYFFFKTWFENSGAKILYSINTSLIAQIRGPHLTLQDLCRLNSYISPETHVVVLITAKMITNQGILTTKNHWIVWTDKLKLHNGLEITEQTAITEKVQLELFSWGKVKKWWTSKTLGEIMEYSFAAMVVSKIP